MGRGICLLGHRLLALLGLLRADDLPDAVLRAQDRTGVVAADQEPVETLFVADGQPAHAVLVLQTVERLETGANHYAHLGRRHIDHLEGARGSLLVREPVEVLLQLAGRYAGHLLVVRRDDNDATLLRVAVVHLLVALVVGPDGEAPLVTGLALDLLDQVTHVGVVLVEKEAVDLCPLLARHVCEGELCLPVPPVLQNVERRRLVSLVGSHVVCKFWKVKYWEDLESSGKFWKVLEMLSISISYFQINQIF